MLYKSYIQFQTFNVIAYVVRSTTIVISRQENVKENHSVDFCHMYVCTNQDIYQDTTYITL